MKVLITAPFSESGLLMHDGEGAIETYQAVIQMLTEMRKA
jgi:hypothetical protein